MSAQRAKSKPKPAAKSVYTWEFSHEKFMSPDGYPMVVTRLANGSVPFFQVAQFREDLIRQGLVPCSQKRPRKPLRLTK